MSELLPAPAPEGGGSQARTLDPPAVIVAGFLSSETCRLIQGAMDRGAAEPAEVLAHGPALDKEARRALSIEVDASTLGIVEAMLDDVREVLVTRWRVPRSAREGAGFIRYTEGGFYRPHRDRAVDEGWPGAGRRLISVVVFLNSAHRTPDNAGGFTGGDLLIYPWRPDGQPPGTIRVTPRRGSLVAFDAGLLHEVCPVTAGRRDVIVDWIMND